MADKKKDTTPKAAPAKSRVEVLREKLEEAERAEKLAAENRKIALRTKFQARFAKSETKVASLKARLDSVQALYDEAVKEHEALAEEGKQFEPDEDEPTGDPSGDGEAGSTDEAPAVED